MEINGKIKPRSWHPHFNNGNSQKLVISGRINSVVDCPGGQLRNRAFISLPCDWCRHRTLYNLRLCSVEWRPGLHQPV